MPENIRPRDLPPVTDGIVNPNAATIVDGGGQVQRATPLQVVDAAAPIASQADAEAGTDNAKRMTALRVKQAIAAPLAGKYDASNPSAFVDASGARAALSNSAPVFQTITSAGASGEGGELHLNYDDQTGFWAVDVSSKTLRVFRNRAGTPLVAATFSEDTGRADFIQIPTILGAPLDGTMVVYKQPYSTSAARTVERALSQGPVCIRDFFRADLGDTTANWSPALQRALDTGKSVYIPGSTDEYRLLSGVTVQSKGQRLLGDGVQRSVIRVPSTFNMASPAVIQFTPACNESHAGMDDVGIIFDQSTAPANRAALISYPPAVLAQDVSRMLFGSIRISLGTDGISARGNCGGMTIYNFECSCFGTHFNPGKDIPGAPARGDNAGALDFITVYRFSSWPHDMTPQQYALYEDGNTIGLDAGRVEALNITHRLAYTLRDIIGASEGRVGFGVIGYSGDARGCRIDFNGGQYTIRDFYKTSDRVNDYAIKQTNGFLRVQGGWTAMTGGGTQPAFEILGGHFYMGNFQHLSGSADAEIVRVAGGAVAAIDQPDVVFGTGTTRTAGFWRAMAGSRITLNKPRLPDRGSGTGPALVVDQDDWHDIEVSATVGWTRPTFPTGPLGIYRWRHGEQFYPQYADNAAAVAGGLAGGEFYRTADGTVKQAY